MLAMLYSVLTEMVIFPLEKRHLSTPHTRFKISLTLVMTHEITIA